MENNPDLDDFHSVGRSWFRLTAKSVVVLLVLLLITAGAVYWLVIQSPKFYRASLRVPEEVAFKSGESFEVAGLYLRNDIVEEETWYAEFFEDHINGWLASDMPRKFATAMPENMHDPRVRIEPHKFRVGVTTEIGGIDTVLVGAIEFFPTDVSNEFGLRVLSVRAGRMPIPVSFFNLPATELLQKHGIRVRWFDDEHGMPVAVLNFPKRLLGYQGKRIVLEQLEFVDGSVRLAGRSEMAEKKKDSEPSAKNPKSESENAESKSEAAEHLATEAAASEAPVADARIGAPVSE